MQNETANPTYCLVVPASFAQQRLWFLEQFLPGTSVYNVPGVWRIRGPLDVDALARSLDELIRRHEVLRTTFASENGRVMQLVSEKGQLPMPIVDLSAAPDAESEALRIIKYEIELPFDLSNGPLIRSGLIKLHDQQHILMLTMHHVVSDLWSLGIVSRELRALYNAFSGGEASPLPDLPIQYADYSVWQREWLERSVGGPQLEFWKQYLDGAPETVALPTDRPRPASATYSGAWVDFEFGIDLSVRLRQFAQSQQVSQFMLMATIFNILLYRHSGQNDICIGYPLYNRNRSEIEGLIGFFLNTLVLRTRLSGEETFANLLRQVRDSVLEADAHQDLPFEKLVEELHPKRDVSRHPLFQIALSYVGVDYDELTLSGLDLEWVRMERDTSKFDLTLAITETPEEILAGFEYSTDLFDALSIDRLINHFKMLVEAVLRNPEARICDLPLLSARERRQLLVEWNETDAELNVAKSVHQIFEEQAAKMPGNVAVVSETRRLTYGELNARGNKLAHHLRSLGVGPETVVPIYIQREPELIIAQLAVLKAGGAFLTLDAEDPAERLSLKLSDAGSRIVISQLSLSNHLPVDDYEVFCLDSQWNVVDKCSEANLENVSDSKTLAYCIYTSGSTGRPKLVGIPHLGLLNLVSWHQQRYQLTSTARATQLAGLSFDASVWEIWPYLTAGAGVYLFGEEIRRSPRAIIDWLAENSISHCFLPTPLAELALAETWPQEIALKALLTGGDQLHRRGPDECSFSTVNHYGPTEYSVVATSGVVEISRDSTNPPTIGRPIANTQIYILDDHYQPVPIGAIGELFVGGLGLARGYANDPKLTAANFIPNPFGKTGSRLYRTGDLARYFPNGEIAFLGRKDNQVKVRGFRIEPGEIETVLAAHPDIRECVVVAVENERDEKQLVAYVGPVDPSSDPQQWRSYLNDKLPVYMVPSTFVKLPELPKLGNGKVNRRALPKPTAIDLEIRRARVAPRTAVEREIAQIWCELLGLNEVSVYDDFFEIGGQSLLAIHLLSRLRAVWGFELTLRTIFDYSVLADFAEQVEMVLRYTTQPQIVSTKGEQQREIGEI